MGSKRINFKKSFSKYSNTDFIAVGIVILVVSIIAIPTFIMLNKRAEILETASLESGVITGCEARERRSRHGRVGRKLKTVYAPVAMTDNGAKAVASINLSPRSLCKTMIGKKVSIYVHPTDKKKNFIANF